MDPKQPISHITPRFDFNSLPLEIRELIWEFTLPDCRLFHVRSFSRQRLVRDEEVRQMFLIFHIPHPPPTALGVCAEARTVALRKGFFLSPHGDFPGLWFNPDKDVLYLDRNQRTRFHIKPGEPRMSIPGWDRVLNVGLEWRAFFRDIPRPSPDETMASYWRAAIEPLYAYMPRMRTINYILPQVRYKGGISWGREPYGAPNFDAQLVPLPEDTPIPWETTRNMGNGVFAPRPQLMGEIQETRRPAATVVTWGEVKNDIEKGFEEVEDDGNQSAPQPHDPSFYPPQVNGWWLVRAGFTIDHENTRHMAQPRTAYTSSVV
ncbi:hypothetical protein B0T10DRAFT_203264 [Thelonectria olida]|uniref:2EXR domain-containing protein n=1 Tax=Thelonectria olida TaxID=1576542 RepID=A0A9P9AJU7_9HYPO|nr:hypothetical protein B0T10DRAFT_203264 [Thelonectria olida]